MQMVSWTFCHRATDREHSRRCVRHTTSRDMALRSPAIDFEFIGQLDADDLERLFAFGRERLRAAPRAHPRPNVLSCACRSRSATTSGQGRSSRTRHRAVSWGRQCVHGLRRARSWTERLQQTRDCDERGPCPKRPTRRTGGATRTRNQRSHFPAVHRRNDRQDQANKKRDTDNSTNDDWRYPSSRCFHVSDARPPKRSFAISGRQRSEPCCLRFVYLT
jgi:hypothetical protein